VKPELINEDDASIHNDQIAVSFEAQDDEEEKREEDEDGDTPLLPEIIAASFEAVKPELINKDDASVHNDQIAVTFEAQDNKEEIWEEDEDGDTPLSPEMIAASFEAVKPELINEDDVSVHDDQIAVTFEAQDDNEEIREDDEDGDAPLPPEMIAGLFEASDNGLISEDNAPAPPNMIAGAFEGYDNEEEKREEDEDGDAHFHQR